jgi:hypothetical protein
MWGEFVAVKDKIYEFGIPNYLNKTYRIALSLKKRSLVRDQKHIFHRNMMQVLSFMIMIESPNFRIANL